MGSITDACESGQNEISALTTSVNGGDFAPGQGVDLYKLASLFLQKSFNCYCSQCHKIAMYHCKLCVSILTVINQCNALDRSPVIHICIAVARLFGKARSSHVLYRIEVIRTVTF